MRLGRRCLGGPPRVPPETVGTPHPPPRAPRGRAAPEPPLPRVPPGKVGAPIRPLGSHPTPAGQPLPLLQREARRPQPAAPHPGAPRPAPPNTTITATRRGGGGSGCVPQRRPLRQEGGEGVHGGEDGGVRALEGGWSGEAAGIGKSSHVGGPGGGDTVGAVLDDDARLGCDPERAGGVEEEIGRRLAPGDVGRAEDPPLESLVEPGQPEGVAQPLVPGAGRDAGRQRDGVERFDDAVDGPQFAVERLPVERPVRLVPVRGQRPPEVLLDRRPPCRRRSGPRSARRSRPAPWATPGPPGPPRRS